METAVLAFGGEECVWRKSEVEANADQEVDRDTPPAEFGLSDIVGGDVSLYRKLPLGKPGSEASLPKVGADAKSPRVPLVPNLSFVSLRRGPFKRDASRRHGGPLSLRDSFRDNRRRHAMCGTPESYPQAQAPRFAGFRDSKGFKDSETPIC